MKNMSHSSEYFSEEVEPNEDDSYKHGKLLKLMLPLGFKIINLNHHVSFPEEIIPAGFTPIKLFKLDDKQQIEGVLEIIDRHKAQGLFEDLIVIDRELENTATLYTKGVQPSRY